MYLVGSKLFLNDARKKKNKKKTVKKLDNFQEHITHEPLSLLP